MVSTRSIQSSHTPPIHRPQNVDISCFKCYVFKQSIFNIFLFTYSIIASGTSVWTQSPSIIIVSVKPANVIPDFIILSFFGGISRVRYFPINSTPVGTWRSIILCNKLLPNHFASSLFRSCNSTSYQNLFPDRFLCCVSAFTHWCVSSQSSNPLWKPNHTMHFTTMLCWQKVSINHWVLSKKIELYLLA